MIRHISVFTFLDTPLNGKTKQENIEEVYNYLVKIPELNKSIVNQHIGRTLGGTPDLPEDAPVMFGDLIQVADFETLADANSYPSSKAHSDLVEFSNPMLKKVTAIDYEMK